MAIERADQLFYPDLGSQENIMVQFGKANFVKTKA